LVITSNDDGSQKWGLQGKDARNFQKTIKRQVSSCAVVSVRTCRRDRKIWWPPESRPLQYLKAQGLWRVGYISCCTWDVLAAFSAVSHTSEERDAFRKARHLKHKGSALMLVGLARVELATNGLGNRCSIHLSYSPVSNSLLQQALNTIGALCVALRSDLRQPAGLTSSMSAKKPSASVGWI
jgi:hypothetical protein